MRHNLIHIAYIICVYLFLLSAGVGRTGTFITIDAMIQRSKERDDLNIYEFVTEMRSKRTFMVRTKVENIILICDNICRLLHVSFHIGK